jgi:hypothetical protein
VNALEAAAMRTLPRSLPLAGKRPLLADWPNVVATPERVREWWSRWPDANLGVRTGGGLAVLDVDPRHGGDRALAELVQAHGELPSTPEVATGGGGRHMYFRGPKVLASRDVAPGVEMKADGRQVVAPPSIHPESGRPYVWQPGRPFDPRAFAELPIWLRPAEPAPRPLTGAARPADDPLRSIPATSYVPELSGRPLDRRGFVCCPLHADGEERTASLLAGGRDPSLWHCFGCGAGGSVYDFAALLAGYKLPLRGEAFRVVRDGLHRHYADRHASAAA